MIKAFALGVVLTMVVLLVGAYFFMTLGYMPVRADIKPGWLETWMAQKSLHAYIQKEAPRGPVPIALNNPNLSAGVKLYAANCAVCHGASDGKPSNIALGLYQEAPQLAKNGVEDDPEGVTFWKVKHGIRLTGMPGFNSKLSDDQIWQVSLFLKHMDSLPPEVDKQWKAVPSSAVH